MTLYTGHSVKIHPDGAVSAVNFGAITNFDCPLGVQLLNEVTAGSPYAGQINVQSVDPRMTFSTRSIARAISTFGLLGLTITGVTNPGVEAFMAQLENGVIRSGSVHRKFQIRRGRAFLRRISVSNREDAQADVEVMSLFDGTNKPLIPTQNVALPALPSDSERFTIQSATIGGIPIPCLQSVEIDFGLNITMDSCSSNPYNDHLSVEQVQPSITLRSLNVDLFGEAVGKIGLNGVAATQLNTQVILQKRSQDSNVYYPGGDAEHIKITSAGMLTLDNAFNASANKRGEAAIRLTSKFDGTNAPFVFTTAFAYA